MGVTVHIALLHIAGSRPSLIATHSSGAVAVIPARGVHSPSRGNADFVAVGVAGRHPLVSNLETSLTSCLKNIVAKYLFTRL